MRPLVTAVFHSFWHERGTTTSSRTVGMVLSVAERHSSVHLLMFAQGGP
jgi:hypothetical protein